MHTPWPIRKAIALILVIGGATLALMPNPVTYRPLDPNNLNQTMYGVMLVWNALPAILWGLAFVAVSNDLALFRGQRWPLVVGGAIAVVGTIVTLAASAQGRRGDFLLAEHVAGAGLLLAALADWRPWFGSLRVARWGRDSYGIYLVHIAVLLGIQAILFRHRAAAPMGSLLLLFAAATAGSILVASILGGSRFTRWMVT